MPRADVIFAMDRKFWHVYGHDIPEGPELWTTNKEAAAIYGLHHIRGQLGGGMSGRPDIIRMGGNSGFQGLQLALHFGAARVILLGYDMQQTFGQSHFHGDHIKGLGNPLEKNFPRWVQAFKEIPYGTRSRVVNASRHTALDCFVRMKLETCLSESAA